MPELDAVADFLADRVIVDVPGNLRPGQHQAAGIGPHLVGILADGPFHEQPVADDVGIVGEELARQVFVLLQARQGVMRDLASPRRRRSDLDGAHPARLGQAGRNDRLPPGVLRNGGHRIGRGRDHEVRRPELAASCHFESSDHRAGGGRSFGSPFGAPAAAHFTIVSI